MCRVAGERGRVAAVAALVTPSKAARAISAQKALMQNPSLFLKAFFDDIYLVLASSCFLSPPDEELIHQLLPLVEFLIELFE